MLWSRIVSALFRPNELPPCETPHYRRRDAYDLNLDGYRTAEERSIALIDGAIGSLIGPH